MSGAGKDQVDSERKSDCFENQVAHLRKLDQNLQSQLERSVLENGFCPMAGAQAQMVKSMKLPSIQCQFPTKKTEQAFENLLMDPVFAAATRQDEGGAFRRCVEEMLEELGKKIEFKRIKIDRLQKKVEFGNLTRMECLSLLSQQHDSEFANDTEC